MYLIPGSLINTTPWPPTDWASYPVMKVKDVPAPQIDFVQGIYTIALLTRKVVQSLVEWMRSRIGIKFCFNRRVSYRGFVEDTLDKSGTY